MKKIAYVCMILAALCLFSACGKDAGEASRESVVKKEAEQLEGYQPEQTRITEGDAFSKDGLTASLTGLTYEEVVTNINIHVKNDTEEELHVITANLSVNGLMSNDSMFITVPAASEANGVVSLANSWLAEMKIEKIAEIEFVIKAFNSLNDEVLASEVLTFRTDAPASYKQTYDDSGFEIYNDNGIKISARSLQKSALSNDMEIVFYAENNTDSTISVMSQDVSVNGIEMDPLFVLTVGAGKKAVDTMVFYDADLKESNITDMESVAASFKAFNEDLETVFETEILNVPIG